MAQQCSPTLDKGYPLPPPPHLQPDPSASIWVKATNAGSRLLEEGQNNLFQKMCSKVSFYLDFNVLTLPFCVSVLAPASSSTPMTM